MQWHISENLFIKSYISSTSHRNGNTLVLYIGIVKGEDRKQSLPFQEHKCKNKKIMFSLLSKILK